ncbi:hypothetical protein, partial [Capnocytophaga gingivalis]
ICFDEKIPTEAIEKVTYVHKSFEASVIEGCFKGSQFFIDEHIAKHLDKKMRRKVYDRYCCDPNADDFFLYREYTAFEFKQGDHIFVADILGENLIKECCKGCENYVMTAIIFTFYTKSGTYKEILVEKGTKKCAKK